jgi:hypothetical protein
MLQAFAAATSEKPHGYLLIDMKQQTPEMGIETYGSVIFSFVE